MVGWCSPRRELNQDSLGEEIDGVARFSGKNSVAKLSEGGVAERGVASMVVARTNILGATYRRRGWGYANAPLLAINGDAVAAIYRRRGQGCAKAPLLAINGDAVAVRPLAVVAERCEHRGRARGHGRAGGGRRKWPAVVLCRTTGGAASIRGARGARGRML